MKQIEISKYLKNEYPEILASNFDIGKIGLQFGSNNKEINKVMIALDGTSKVVDQALNMSCDLLICHHPFLFYPLLSLDYDSPFGQKFIKVLNNKLNIYSMHTNFDTAENGMNDILSEIIGMKNVNYLKAEIDSTCLMRVGEIEPVKFEDFLNLVCKKFDHAAVKFVGNLQKTIKKVGIVGGSGSSEIKNAIKNGCDCFITGEIPHHLGLEALDYGISLIEINHFTESLFKETLKNKLEKQFPTIEFILAEEEDPFKNYAYKK